MANDRFSIGESIKYGWETVKGNLGFWIGMAVVGIIVSMIPNALSSAPGIRNVGILRMVLSLVGMLVGFFISIGYVTIGLKATSNQKAEIGDLFTGAPYIVNAIIAGLIAGIACAIGFVFLIVPGIYLAARLGFVYFFIVDKKLAGVDAVKASWALTAPYHIDLFLFTLALMVLNFVGAIPCGLGLLVTMPISIVAISDVYRRIV